MPPRLPLISSMKQVEASAKPVAIRKGKDQSDSSVQTSNGINSIRTSAVKLKWPMRENWTNLL